MHIEKRKAGRRKKYYLAHSFRRGARVKKVRVYLGVDLSEAEIAYRKKHAENELQDRLSSAERLADPYIAALSPVELNELRTLEARGRIKVIHLSELGWLKFTEAFTYDTNAIEGSRVEAREVADILEKGKWPAERSKEDISETYGVAEAVGYIRKTKKSVSIKLIKKLHEIVFKNSKHFAGKLRGRGIEVVVADAYGNVVHRGAPSAEVEKLLGKLVRWYDKSREKYPPIVLAAVVHNQFENIHPFEDGNGRVGRLLLNNILLKHNLSPINIEFKNRGEYYAALQAYEKNRDLRPTLELMLKEYRALKRMLKKR